VAFVLFISPIQTASEQRRDTQRFCLQLLTRYTQSTTTKTANMNNTLMERVRSSGNIPPSLLFQQQTTENNDDNDVAFETAVMKVITPNGGTYSMSVERDRIETLFAH
jgi:hypothetical protein